MKIIYIISRIFTGLVFALSGLSKAVDPVGTEIKFGEYFNAMGLEFLSPFALILSFLMNAAELSIGLMLIFNLFPRLASWSALGFLTIFTPVMLWLAITDAVTDCGCFGDFLTLSNWQTFWKNIIFLSFVIFLILFGKQFKSKLAFKKSLIGIIIFFIISLGFEFYNYKNLPLVDFRPYKIGVNIIQASTIPEDAEQDVYETVLFYKNLNTNESKPFSIDDIPYEDTLNWAYDTTITELISKGYEPPIYDFFLTEYLAEDITEDILNSKNLNLIFVLHKISKELPKVKNELDLLAEYANLNNLNIYCFTSSGSIDIESVKNEFPNNLTICTGDYKMLKTLIRSNPGLVLIKDAVLLNKYHYRNIPDISEINKYK